MDYFTKGATPDSWVQTYHKNMVISWAYMLSSVTVRGVNMVILFRGHATVSVFYPARFYFSFESSGANMANAHQAGSASARIVGVLAFVDTNHRRFLSCKTFELWTGGKESCRGKRFVPWPRAKSGQRGLHTQSHSDRPQKTSITKGKLKHSFDAPQSLLLVSSTNLVSTGLAPWLRSNMALTVSEEVTRRGPQQDPTWDPRKYRCGLHSPKGGKKDMPYIPVSTTKMHLMNSRADSSGLHTIETRLVTAWYILFDLVDLAYSEHNRRNYEQYFPC
eukprot:gene7389-5202_t